MTADWLFDGSPVSRWLSCNWIVIGAGVGMEAGIYIASNGRVHHARRRMDWSVIWPSSLRDGIGNC